KPHFNLEIPPEGFGDLSSNIALRYSKVLKKNPREVAEDIVKELSKNPLFQKIEVAGPGFINFWFSKDALLEILKKILDLGERAFEKNIGNSLKIQFEYGSANPTGPFTVGHGRQIVIGDVLASVYEILGFDVTRELYLNDAGRQIDLLAYSLWVRYNQVLGREDLEIPEDGYKGEYLIDLAKKLVEEWKDKYLNVWNEDVKKIFRKRALEEMVKGMKKTIEKIGSEFDVFYSESSLIEDGTVNKVLELLREKGYIYEKEGATWFKVSKFVDEDDKVLIKRDGSFTYFLTDIAYHYKKYERGFKKVFDIWGSDHHGHINRMRAAMKALGISEDFLNVIIHQFVTLKKSGEIVKMSTRAGRFITLNDLIDEVGVDAVRYFFSMVDPNTHMVFDVDLAKMKTMENPVYYVQYAHARISSLFRNAKEKNIKFVKGKNLDLLENEHERKVLRKLDLFDEVLEDVALTFSPNKLTRYLEDLSHDFHVFYTHNTILDPENPKLSNARLNLSLGVQIVIKKGLGILGVKAPDRM
ncbi:MAG TPA: arginine--tRNA ligase, partial [Thermotoga sp.]|nr:arginine--tRNA ligase [Thermotoga sp.]